MKKNPKNKDLVLILALGFLGSLLANVVFEKVKKK